MTTIPFNINGITGDLSSGSVVKLAEGVSLRRYLHVAWVEYSDLDEITEGSPALFSINPGSHINDVLFSGDIPMGTRKIHYIYTPTLRISDTDTPFLNWYSTWWDGTIAESIDFLEESLGPTPDPEATESTGSGRIDAYRNLLMLWQSYHLDEDLLRPSEYMRWVKEQSQRGCSFRKDGQLYYTFENQQNYFGQGYQSDPNNAGGFSTLYNSILPPGVPDTTGKYIGHATHGTIEGLVGAAVLTKDACAAEMAILTMESWASSLLSGEIWYSRTFGRYFRGLALLASLTPYFPWLKERITRYTWLGLDALSARMNTVEGLIAPDNGKTSEAYHLTNAQLTEALEGTGIEQDAIQELARSDVSWMVSQCADGLLDLHELFLAYDLIWVNNGEQTLDQAIRLAVKNCAWFLQRSSTAAIPLEKVGGKWTLGDYRSPEMGWWDDCNGYGISKGSIHNSGVGSRFLLRTLYRVDVFLGNVGTSKALEPRGRDLYEYSFQNDVWGGSETTIHQWMLGK